MARIAVCVKCSNTTWASALIHISEVLCTACEYPRRVVQAAEGHCLEAGDDCVQSGCAGTLVSAAGQFGCSVCTTIILLPEGKA